MNISDIQTLYEYNYWANDQIFEAARRVTVEQYEATADLPYGSLRGTLLHIVEAEHLWRARFQDTAFSSLAETELPTLDSLEYRRRQEETTMRTYLAGLTDQDMELRPGLPWWPPRVRALANEGFFLWHCLVHVVNHGTQHRSEAAALLTEYGQSPGQLDFLVYVQGGA